MYVTEAAAGQQELTVQIDISMPHLAQNDLSYPGANNKRFSKRSNLQGEKRQSVYHKRCTLEELLEPALSPSNSQGSGSQGQGSKKPFITVVKSGKFLDPPEKTNYYLKNSHGGSQVLVYSYCSRPRVMQPAVKVRSKENLKFANNNNNSSLNNFNYYQANNKTFLQTNENSLRSKRSIISNESNQQDGGPNPYGNIMYDKRVVRGSNFTQHPTQTHQPKWNPYFGYAKLLSQPQPAERLEESRRRAAARRRVRPSKAFRKLGTPPPVDGRHHTNIQTDLNLEEIIERPRELEASCQTESAWERPRSPPYVPIKHGTDQYTQVWPGELFDFENDSQPVVGGVVGRALEQALSEVLQEEEVAALRAQQRRLHELRLAEWAEARRVQEREFRLQKEKEVRTMEQEQAYQEQKKAEERAAALALSQAMLEELLPSVLEGLAEAGQIPAPVQKEVETGTGVMPWLVEEVAQEMKTMITSRHVISDIVKEVLETRAELRRALGDEVDEEEQPKSGDDDDEENS
ncbi:radial spoke head protein 3 homolog B isoform X2 [Neocloeon triangulifer]|uniref:radial spoke head protein 3 homolog B isoform X2 n=1 Tax=Neocloeon triangulifer TaxID=2078957 RepID=UPI00286F560E|nr:radial spoke head protein 3 homolog B isoform X2 [Neocloeon triangulifer]